MPSYRDALEWIALNDDTSFMEDADNVIPSVSVSFVADIWDKDVNKVIKDLRRVMNRLNR
jgi:hypothetical protein